MSRWIVRALLACVVATVARGAEPQVVTLPAPTGPARVGSFLLDFTDPARMEPFPGRNEHRRLPLHIWYPASPAPCTAATYMDSVTAAAYHRSLRLPEDLGHSVKVHSCAGAPFSREAPSKRPVILFSPGLGETPYSYTSILEDLASHGYVVVAIQHTYSARTTVFADGKVAPWDDGRWEEESSAKLEMHIRQNIEEWTADARAVLTFLAQLDRTVESPVKGHLDLNRIGYAGHSYGGYAAVLTASRDPRIRAVANIDGKIFEPTKTPLRLRVPLLLLMNELNGDLRRQYRLRRGDVTEVVGGATHTTFSDLNFLFSSFGLPEHPPAEMKHQLLSGEEGIALTRARLRDFFDRPLRSR